MAKGTVRLHRVLKAPQERGYRALLDSDAKVKWLSPDGFTGKVHLLDAMVGGTYRMSSINFTTDQSHSFGGEYLELVPHEKVRYLNRFDEGELPGVIEVTATLRPVMGGTELDVVQEGNPQVNPEEMCSPGWPESLNLLKRLIEPEFREPG